MATRIRHSQTIKSPSNQPEELLQPNSAPRKTATSMQHALSRGNSISQTTPPPQPTEVTHRPPNPRLTSPSKTALLKKSSPQGTTPITRLPQVAQTSIQSQNAPAPFITVKKAVATLAIGAATFFLLGPLGLAFPLFVVGIAYMQHQGYFARLQDKVIEAINSSHAHGTASSAIELPTLGQRSYYPIAESYPQLKSLKSVPICDMPTPIEKLSQLESTIKEAQGQSNISLYVKNDGKSNSAIYGGNKVRKLELLLAQALERGDKEIMTFGTAGSYSVLGTVLHAQALGLQSSVYLAPQIPSSRVAQNLLKLARAIKKPLPNLEETQPPNQQQRIQSGIISYSDGLTGVIGKGILKGLKSFISSDDMPFIIPPGATSTLSTVAYVNAMFELADDVRSGRLPEVPKKIFVPAGSSGTFIGLLIGQKAIPMFRNTEIIAVDSGSNRSTLQRQKHFEDVVDFLVEKTNGAFPRLNITQDELNGVLDKSFFGDQYAARTPSANEAEMLLKQDGLMLESTYSAKTMARLIADARKKHAEGDTTPESWLFWNTNNAIEPQLEDESNQPISITHEDRALLRRFMNNTQIEHYFS